MDCLILLSISTLCILVVAGDENLWRLIFDMKSRSLTKVHYKIYFCNYLS